MKILKRLAIAIIILVVLFVIAGFAASRFINKEMVEKQVSAATGREFKIEGDLKPGFSLTPSVSAEKVSLSNAAWGSRPQLATIGKFNIQVQLLPLLEKKIVVDKIEIDSADILLEQKNGQWNFAFDQAKANADVDKDKPAAGNKKLAFDISALNITNSKLTIKQGGEPVIVTVKTLKLTPHDKLMALDFEGIVDNKPLKVTVDLPPVGDLMSGKNIDVANLNITSEDMKVKANLQADMATKKVTINSFDFTKADIALSGKGWADINSKKVELVSFTGSKGDVNISAHITADLNAKRVEVSNLVARKGDLKLNGGLSADISGKKPYIKGSLSADSITMAPAGGKDSKSSAASSSSGKSSDAKLPLDALDQANADVKLSIGKFVSGDIVLDKISVMVKLNNGVLIINPLTAGFANGQIAANATLSKSGARVNLKASNLLMEKVLMQTAGFNDFKGGLSDIDLALAGSGNTMDGLVNSLSGTSKVTMKSATYSGQVLKGHAAQLVTLLRGGNANQPIDINCVAAAINWNNGTGDLQQMGIDTKYANLTGKGQIILPGHRLNLALTPVSKISGMNNLAPQVKVGGTFEDPEVSYADIVKDIGTSAVKNLGTSYLQSLSSGKKFKLNTKTALGIDKTATITSPCGAASATVPTTTPGAAAATPDATATPAAAPDQPQQLSKQQKKQQKIQAIGAGLKQLGF